MKRTSVTMLVVLAVVAGVAIVLIQSALANSGRAIIVFPVTLPLALAAIGAIVVVMAAPIRRTTRRPPNRPVTAVPRPTTGRGPVDPFYATRVVALAKASAVTGALLTGVGAGALLYVLTASATPPVGSIASTTAGLVGAAALLACGLVAEAMCRVPPGDDDDDDGSPAQARP